MLIFQMRNFRLLWLVSLILEATYGLSTVNDLIILNRLKKAYWLPVRPKKEEQVDKIANRHMLKQPLMKFDLLWKKFHGRKRSPPQLVFL
ncbi:hypothetical protein Y032_0024g991 [Ancylostoma ceylanicum]|uniref:Secreted protein n=2 Tax=Ancylostoma ceylanicum TaxID=53326 RepID=A0A016UYV7_9BILA|nr:hypothetical protein Y032_0024g991 [Ancylostoma ceylanicum]